MNVHASPRPRCRWLPVVAFALSLSLAACRQEPPAPAPTQAPIPVLSPRIATMDIDALREAALKAYGEYRVYAPAGNNAVEYYLGLRDKLPGDVVVASALLDLLPMTVVGAEQSIAREDFAEAQRLVALLEKGDAHHPALARLKADVRAGQAEVAARAAQQVLTAEALARKQAELERQRLADQKQQQAQLARQLATRQAVERRLAQQHEVEQRSTERPPPVAGAAAGVAAQPASPRTEPGPPPPSVSVPGAEPTPVRATAEAAVAAPASALRAIALPPPRYPSSAELTGQSGEVLVEFTVGTDGQVTSARVVRATPPRVFDHEAVKAVRKWRFQPLPAPVTTRRTIRFSPQQ